MKRSILTVILMIGFIGAAEAQVCTSESFDSPGTGMLYGLQNIRGDRHSASCSYPVNWQSGDKWCVAHDPNAGDGGAGDGAAHVITRRGEDQFNQGWYWAPSCSPFSATNEDVFRIKLKIRFDSNYRFNTGGTNNKFMIWGSSEGGGLRMIAFLRDEYWTAATCRPYGEGNYPRCTNDGSDCSGGGDADCIDGAGVQYECVSPGTYTGKGAFTFGAGIATPCAGPANAGAATGFTTDEWVYIQYEIKTGSNGYMKLWVNNNDGSEPNACTGSSVDCPASATYGYPAGRNPVTRFDNSAVSNWGDQLTIGDFITDALPQDMGFYLDDLMLEKNGSFDPNWYSAGAPGAATCGDGADNDGDGLTDYPADPGCQSTEDTNENNCGNGSIDGSEVCDGALLGGQTCQTQGYDSGDLGCASSCNAYDASGCVGSSGGGSTTALFTSDFEGGDWSEWNGRQEQSPGDLQVVADPGCPSGSYCARALLSEGTNSDSYAEYRFGDYYSVGDPKVEEVWVSTRVKFDPGYVWPNSGQKIALLNATDGLSSQRRHQVILKVAPEGDWSLQHSYIDSWQFFEKRQNIGSPTAVAFGTWVKLKVYARMNTPGNSDGILRMWVNDQLKTEYTDVNLRQGTDNGFGKLILSSWASDASGSDGVQWYDDWVMSESDPDGSSPPDGNPETPASVWRTDTAPGN